MNPFFSVIITTFNRSKLLERALNSLIAQTFTDWEALVINDGSADNTDEVIQTFLNKKLSIKYFKQENKGEAGAKNTGVSVSSGRYVTFLDSDDEYAPNHLALRHEIIRMHPDIDLVHGGVSIIGDEYVPDKYNTNQLIHLSKCIIGGTFFVKKEVIESLSGFKDMPIATDSELFDRIKSAGFTIHKTTLPTYIYHRAGSDSITKNYFDKIRKVAEK